MTQPSSLNPAQAAAQTFEAALDGRAQAMADACTRCGKCVEVCPVTEPGGLNAEELKNPAAVIGGVVDIVRTGHGNDAARKWASACILSGECIKACDYGVNPRFLLHMARVKMARLAGPAVQRKNGVDGFRKVAREVTQLSRIQLDDALLERLGQGGKRVDGTQERGQEPPDFVFYTGCNVLKTPHIALLALDIMDALGITYEVMGGPTHCCGIVQMRAGDVATSGRVAEGTLGQARPQQDRAGAVMVPVLPGAVRRDDAADHRENARRQTVRNDAVHAVHPQEPRPVAAAVA